MLALSDLHKVYDKGPNPALTGSSCAGSRDDIQAGSNAAGISKHQGDPYLTAAREPGKRNHK